MNDQMTIKNTKIQKCSQAKAYAMNSQCDTISASRVNTYNAESVSTHGVLKALSKVPKAKHKKPAPEIPPTSNNQRRQKTERRERESLQKPADNLN